MKSYLNLDMNTKKSINLYSKSVVPPIFPNLASQPSKCKVHGFFEKSNLAYINIYQVH